MMFISYAQNFEDVLLWRALRDVQAGFYIDVGASHPDVDSVTRAFFDRGWRGINIEPGAEDAARLAAARPGDITLQVAAGRTDGEADFFPVPGTGLSTLLGQPRDLQTGRVAVRTLAGICRTYVRQTIHFLKIDVEGTEADVLAGADLVTYRPWIILVEAVAPLSTIPSHASWEPGLLEQGYRFAWFDGLNRFYVAEEQASALLPCFQTPPNVFDNFIRAADTVWADRIASAETRALLLDDRLRATQAQADAAALMLRERADHSSYEIGRLQQAVSDLSEERRLAVPAEHALKAELARIDGLYQVNHRDLLATRHAFEQTRHALADAQAWLAAVRGSTSWRLTLPIRAILRLLGRSGLSGRPALASGVDLPQPEVSIVPVLEEPAAQDAPLPPGFFDVMPPPPAAMLAPGRLRRSVHQFHSGSAVGDAITTAMILTRTILRGLGYASEIFVTYRDPDLAHELRTIDELPLHDGYVLILRHSMGHDAFDRVAALPAPKILIYHNITPPALLGQHPVLAAYAALGRRQLASLPGHVHAALADSEYNAIELRQLRFAPVRSCMLLLDIAATRARALATRSSRNSVFTLLFVGRICQSKAQVELVEAYNAFRRLYDGPARLVLVGRYGSGTDPYLLSLQRRVAEGPHPNEILLTGLVSDAERDAWYGRADLYVSLSRHEGFGVPLVEAMAHGVAVVAQPSGAVPYTVGNSACLLPADSGPAAIGAILHSLAEDPQRRAAQAAAQLRSLDRFALPGQTAILLQALLRAGADLPTSAASREALEANIHFAVTGHVNGTYSLAEVNRTLALELAADRPDRVRIIPVEGTITNDLSGVPAESRTALLGLAGRPAPLTAPEVIISQHYPVHVPETGEGRIRLALLFWEESLLPAATIATLEAGFDGVVAPTRFVARALQDSGLRLPVRVIAHEPSLSRFQALPRNRPVHAPVTFLHVSSCFPRKGADVLLQAWSTCFTGDDPVRLVIKSFPNPHNTIAADLAALREAYPALAPVTLIDQDLDAAAMTLLYDQADVMVLPTRGEGYNLPAAEALAAGLRLIVTGAGGHLDFCNPGDPGIRLLRYRHAPSASHLATPHSIWFEPDPDDLVAAMREAMQPRMDLSQPTQSVLTSTPRAAALATFAVDLLLQPVREPLRVAWISSWRQKCGVGEYSRLMLRELEAEADLTVTVLCDQRTPDYVPVAGALPHLSCWNIGEPVLDELLQAIARIDAHAVVIQHQPGLMPWPVLMRLIEGVIAQGRVLTVTLHNSRDLFGQPTECRMAVLTALSRADRVIVHTLADLDRLAEAGLSDRISLFPQGAPVPQPPRLPRALTAADRPVIGCYGFFLPGKGIDTLIQAVIRLRREWPGIQLRLVNAAYGGIDSDAELAQARLLAEPLGDAVQFHTGFLPQHVSLDLLSDCDMIVLPYRPSKEASSAALRTALTVSVPVAVSCIALFDEAEDAVQRVDAGSPASLAADLDALLRDAGARRRLQENATRWMQARDWRTITRRLTGLLTGMVRSRS